MVIAAALAVVGCGDDGDATPDDGGGDATEADVPADDGGDVGGEEAGDDAADPPRCMEPAGTCRDTACSDGPFTVTCLGGTALDPLGAPVADRPVVGCAGGRCFFGRTGSDGFFAVAIVSDPVPGIGLYFPGEEPLLTPFCHIEALCDGAVHACDDYQLYPAPATGTAIPLGTLTADLRVSSDDGGAVVLAAGDEVMLPLGVEERLAFTRFPLDEHVPCFIDPDDLPESLYAAYPADTFVIEPGTTALPVLRPVEMDLPNRTGLPAGTAVEFRVVGGSHAADADLEEGVLVPWATGVVGADGTRIATTPGSFEGYFTWFAVYATP
jgi:hypothetical protein